MSGELFALELEPLGFVVDELSARGALVERAGPGALAILPPPLAGSLDLPDTVALADAAGDRAIGRGLGSPLLDGLVAVVRASVAVASITALAEPPRTAVSERLADRVAVRNAVADVLGAEVGPRSTFRAAASRCVCGDERHVVVSHRWRAAGWVDHRGGDHRWPRGGPSSTGVTGPRLMTSCVGPE
jgi:hypothetical protein